MSTLTTRSPYLRDRLLQAADGLRKDAETARLNLAAADQDVAAARALLAEAEAQRRRARDELDGIETGIAWAQAHAATITREIDADPAAKLRATGLMRHEPKAVCRCGAPGTTEDDMYACEADDCVAHDWLAVGGALHSSAPFFPAVDPPEVDDDLTAPGVADTRAQIAPHLPPPVPHDPAGVPVGTHGPTVTMPDTGLNPPPLPPADVTTEARHAKPARPKGSRLTGPLKALISKQDGDTDE